MWLYEKVLSEQHFISLLGKILTTYTLYVKSTYCKKTWKSNKLFNHMLSNLSYTRTWSIPKVIFFVQLLITCDTWLGREVSTHKGWKLVLQSFYFLLKGQDISLRVLIHNSLKKNGEIPDSIIRGTYMYFDPRKGILLNRQYWQFKQKRFYKKHFIKFLEINYIIVYTCTLFFINFARRAKCRVDSVSPKDLQNKSQAMKS